MKIKTEGEKRGINEWTKYIPSEEQEAAMLAPSIHASTFLLLAQKCEFVKLST